ncbi:transcriptional-regulating factor 1 isoform X2 [Gallus gallus]|uniref:transcriptional-regulating factor 1 isoform X2 n=1 Tax=Gallus gallus TaxID=9031 RepID=UPI001AE1BB80|nr:transcriptional-regulating factor 1 isoform X2 [Gallus gallus]XP_040522340.1 transcriptional-regulating factor 1 isoform X2 [Gallus gallus]XP_040522343.1 transcriptional-regulating factor 1 isoform X2 [Gallus gallus]XP_040553324.1 transcriptional-regulating factor 1 isoform X2 [Gallus gallus]
MGDQQLYKTNHTANSNENLYYQHQMNSLPSLNHSYGTSVIDAPQASPLSPQFPQDSRDSIALPVGSKSLGSMDTLRQTWTHSGSGNHIPVRNNLSNQSSMWSPLGQGESHDGYQYSYSQPSENRSQKITSGVLHKLDSFTQVFANQNLRIQVNNMAQVLHTETSMADNSGDSALRQLLSQKPAVEQQPVTSSVQRYQPVPQQTHQNFASTQQKQQMQVMQHQQLYYDYQQHLSQMQIHSAFQQGQTHVQQMQSQQLLPQQMQHLQQTQYYAQPQQGHQRLSIHEIQQQQQQPTRQQQQRQCPMQIAQYYQTQPVMQLQQQQQQMQLQLPPYHREPDPKTVHEPHQYPQDPSHPVQLIQLGAAPPYCYQDPHEQYRHLYPQGLLQQHDQQKQYTSEGRAPSLNSHVGLTPPGTAEDPARSEVNSVGNNVPHRTLLPPSGAHLNNKSSQQDSPGPGWPQVQLSDGRLQPLSPEQSGPNRETLPERADGKNKLTCSVCLKEFKSLPALNGHMRSHGGVRTSPNFKQDEGEKPPQQPLPKEVDSLAPIVMPVSVPVKLLSPEPSTQPSASTTTVKDKPANSMSDDEMPVLVKMTFSPPCSPKVANPCSSSEISKKPHPNAAKLEENFKPLPDKKKYRHRPEPLFIPPPSFNFSTSHSGAMLYQSQLRSPRVLGDHLLDRTHELPPYTPPPMLSPVRHGSGLFSSVITSSHSTAHTQLPLTPLTPTPRVLLCRSSSIDGSVIPVTPGPGEQTVEPRINIGSRFQADIPELQDKLLMEKDVHKATLVWKPWPELENKVFQQRVEDLLNMSCSSVLPGGGTNSEYALHSLFEAKGDIMVTLEKLLLRKPVRLKCHPLANYHYAGSDKWTHQERRLFKEALSTYSKDFIFVQKMVKSKTVAQCVEYYYTWKKILRWGRKHRTRLEKKREECMVFSSRQALNGHARIHGGTNQVTKPRCTIAGTKQKSGTQSGYCSIKSSPAHSTTSGETDPTTIFPCKECDKVFFRIKSRNAHMKTHRQQEEQQRQKAQKAAVAAEMAATIVRTTGPAGHSLIPLDHMSLVKHVGNVGDIDDDVVQELGGVMEEHEVMDADLLLDDEDADLLQDDAEL